MYLSGSAHAKDVPAVSNSLTTAEEQGGTIIVKMAETNDETNEVSPKWYHLSDHSHGNSKITIGSILYSRSLKASFFCCACSGAFLG